MPTNWDTIDPLKIITAENIVDAVNAEKLVPNTHYGTMGPNFKQAMTKIRMSSDVYIPNSPDSTVFFSRSNPYYSSKANLQLLARRDITALRPTIGLEARTILPTAYDALSSANKANFGSAGYKTTQNSSGTSGSGASTYIAGQQFYYAFHFINTGTIVTQGNVVFTITIPNGMSCVLSGGQPIISHLRGGATVPTSVPATLVGNVLTVTITAPTNPYNVSTNPAAYHISVKMVASLYYGWDDGVSTYAVPNIQTVATTIYGTNSPLSSIFYIKVPFSAPTTTKTNTYTGTIPYNEIFDYTLKLGNASEIAATGIIVTDVLPTGVTFVNATVPFAGWTITAVGQTVTINGNADNIPAYYALSAFTIVIRVRATGQNINISNTATVCSSNGFCDSATKTNYIDYNRTPTLESQGYYTCSSNVTYLVYRDTNTNSSTPLHYYVNNISVGTTAPTNGACSYFGSATTTRVSSGQKNNCTNTCSPTTSVAGSTVILNQSGYPSYSTSGTYTSSISQADANAQAQAISDAAYDAGLQAKINAEGYCTWTAANIAGSYNQNFTRNNCGNDCYGNGSVNYANTQYSTATSTSSCTAAISAASTTAYNAAYAVVQSNGQAHANANGTCCCWVSAPDCSGCSYLGNRQRNTCDGSYRNTDPTAYEVCGCGIGCQGTNFTYAWYCDGRDKVYEERYNCNLAVNTGATNRVNCGCDAGSPELTSQGYNTCVGCDTRLVYKDTNRCSATFNSYYVNGTNVGTGAPSNGGCNTSSNHNIPRGIRCFNGNNFDVFEDSNGCGSNPQYLYTNPEPNQPANFFSESFGGDECTFSAYKEGNFTRNNCGSGYDGGTVFFSKTYYRAGLLNQAGVNILADSSFPSDGQNYANSAGSCTSTQSCRAYDIVAFDYGYNVSGYYTYCGGGGLGYFSFYADSSGVIGQLPCANTSSVYITDSGNGASFQEAYTC